MSLSSKFIFSILLPAILVMGAVILLKQHFKSTPPAPVVTAESAPVPVSKSAGDVPPLPLAPVSIPIPVIKTPTPEEREAAVETEKDRLSSLEMNNDAESLSNILADLNSPEKEIRMAAIQAAVQFDSTNAIPVLKAAASNDDDMDEKVALLQAADFLALPDVTFSPGGAPLTQEQVQAAKQRREEMQGQDQNTQQEPQSSQ
jgi:hypothetical protein